MPSSWFERTCTTWQTRHTEDYTVLLVFRDIAKNNQRPQCKFYQLPGNSLGIINFVACLVLLKYKAVVWDSPEIFGNRSFFPIWYEQY